MVDDSTIYRKGDVVVVSFKFRTPDETTESKQRLAVTSKKGGALF